MFGKYQQVKGDTNIGTLPDIINSNNSVTKTEFEYIYDSSNDYLKQSLVADNGKVKAHWGEFVNLKCSHLQVDDLITSTGTTVSGFGGTSSSGGTDKHNKLDNIYSIELWKNGLVSKSDTASIIKWLNTDDGISYYAHDTAIIYTPADASNPVSIGTSTYTGPVSLRTELDEIETIVNGLAKNMTIKSYSDEPDDVLDGSTASTLSASMTYGAAADENAMLRRQIAALTARITALENKSKK